MLRVLRKTSGSGLWVLPREPSRPRVHLPSQPHQNQLLKCEMLGRVGSPAWSRPNNTLSPTESHGGWGEKLPRNLTVVATWPQPGITPPGLKAWLCPCPLCPLTATPSPGTRLSKGQERPLQATVLLPSLQVSRRSCLHPPLLRISKELEIVLGLNFQGKWPRPTGLGKWGGGCRQCGPHPWEGIALVGSSSSRKALPLRAAPGRLAKGEPPVRTEALLPCPSSVS